MGKIDNDLKRASKYRRGIDAPLAPRDCRACRYARINRDGTVRCSQGMWPNVTEKVETFNLFQQLAAVECPYFDDMRE